MVSAITLAVGAAVVAYLTRYNMQTAPAWSSGETPFGRSWEEYLLVNVTGLLLIPILAVAAMPREDLALFGWSRPASGTARPALLLFLLMLPVLVAASRMEPFQRYYPMQPQTALSWRYLLYFEMTYGLYMLTWESFFRGFLTLGMARGFGPVAAVVLQAAAFGIMHIGKPLPEVIGSFAAGLVLGVLALRARSFLPCFGVHWACSATFDLLVIAAVPGGIF
jgi:membrane protease YdiL (CAAX protease family)